MKLATLHKDGVTSAEMEVDQSTLIVQSAGDDVVKDKDWDIYIDGDNTIWYGPVQQNSDGLVVRYLIEVMDWWNATGEGFKKYTLDFSRLEKEFQPLFDDLEGEESEDANTLSDMIFNRRQEILDAHPKSKAEVAYCGTYPSAAATNPWEWVKMWASSDYIDEEEIPTYLVSLYVVPVSVPFEVIDAIHGCGEEFSEQLKESFEEHGDFREYAWDLSSYGHHVPIALEHNGEAGFGIKCKEDELDAVLKKVKTQAYAVQQLFGFYMDRPWNAVGWNGWHVFKEAKAFPGQQQKYEGEAVVKDKDGNPVTCNDCGDEKPCQKLRTIYCAADNDGEWICESCRESWYVCPDCGILVPIEPQSWAGVEWVKIHHEHYCKDCASKIYNGPDCPGVVAGGTELSMGDVRDNSQALHMVDLVDSWERVADWETGWYSHSASEAQIAKYICEWIEREGPKTEFIFGPYEFGQFHARIGLFERKANRDA